MRGSPLALAVSWALSALLGAALIWHLADRHGRPARGGDSGTAAPVAAPAPPPPPAAPGRELAPLRLCAARLAAAELFAARCADPAGHAAPLPDEALPPECLTPRVRASLDRTAAAEATRLLALERARRVEALGKRTALVAGFLGEALSLSSEEQAWLGEYVCAARELAGSIVAPPEPAAGPAAASFDELRLEREALLGDLEAFLGTDRYERLRAVGGIGLLAEAFDCR